jgi:heat shock protein HslJ/uncharacterized lipoprotein YbaY
VHSITKRASCVAAVLSLGLGACATPDTKPVADPLIIQGSLTYTARIALPPDSRAVVELRDESVPAMPVVGEQRMDLKGAQVPIPFRLSVDRTGITPGHRYAVRGAITSAGQASWVFDPMQIDAAKPGIDVGVVTLKPFQALAFSTVFYCGDARVEVGFRDGAMRMRVLNQTVDLRQAVSASGARYEAVDDPRTSFWNKGRRATLVVRGREFPECIEGEPSLPLRASGNEPGWRLDIAPSGMTLIADAGVTRLESSLAEQTRIAEGMRYGARGGTSEITADVVDRLCRDSMTGMPHPYSVTVTTSGRVLRGCGGEPAALLRGGEWVVEDLDGGGIIDSSRATVQFGDNGRVSGRASCNTYTAHYALSGEGISVRDPVVTQRACAPSLMVQEERFLTTLRGVRSFDFTSDGALVLKADGKRLIKARRGA